MKRQELREWLEGQAEEDYQKFSAALIPGSVALKGIRIPALRKKAKEIAAGDWREFLGEYGICGGRAGEKAAGEGKAAGAAGEGGKAAEDEWFEELQLQGMVIGCVKAEPEEILSLARAFVPKINNWSVNDAFCSSFRLAKREPQMVWEFLLGYKDSSREFEQRVAAILAMGYFLTDAYIDQVLKLLAELRHEGYYLKMGVAWAVATAYAKYPEKTMLLLRGGGLDEFTWGKAIQKMLESRRVPDDDKQLLRRMRAAGQGAASDGAAHDGS